jgi:3-oxoacyl-[acyl-carrier-protein] synthase III
MRLSNVYLAGIGVCLPERVTAEAAIASGAYTAEEAKRSGWRSVTVAGSTPAPDLAVAAANQALERSGVAGDEIALLVHADLYHQGPDLWPPQQYVQRHTIGGNAPAFEVRQGCNGMIGAIGLAAGYLAVSGSTAALLTGAGLLALLSSGVQVFRPRTRSTI